MSKAYIYTLSNPITSSIFYVGKTVKPKERYWQHVGKYKKNRGNANLAAYIDEMILNGNHPTMNIVEECDDSTWQIKEKHWISFYRESNNLFNITDGGLGSSGSKITERARAKIIAYNTGCKKHWLSREEFHEISALKSSDLSSKEIASKIGVSRYTVNKVLLGKITLERWDLDKGKPIYQLLIDNEWITSSRHFYRHFHKTKRRIIYKSKLREEKE